MSNFLKDAELMLFFSESRCMRFGLFQAAPPLSIGDDGHYQKTKRKYYSNFERKSPSNDNVFDG